MRRDGEIDVRPVALAGRMLRLLERELCAVEGQGTVDLERLDKLAATLRRLEPLRQAYGGPGPEPHRQACCRSWSSIATATTPAVDGRPSSLVGDSHARG
jgi:hypothetical protein